MLRSTSDANRPVPIARSVDAPGHVTDAVEPVTAPAPTDLALVSRMAAGDQGAMQLLVQRYEGVVFGLARTICREPADAEEVAADAFMQAWRNAATFDPARSSVVGWLGVMTRSRALDRLRAYNRQGKYLTQESEFTQVDASRAAQSDVVTPDRAAEQSEARTLVAGALRELPDAQREVIELAYFGGLSQSEIAARLSMPLGTVKTRTLAALKQLRTRLGPLLREGLA
jgi:RNA polymerase sigma-70 factor (ECF subfamily)